MGGGQCLEVGLVHQAEGTDDGHVELLHHQPRRHGGEGALEGLVHEERHEDVVHVVPQGDLVTTQFVGGGKELLATVPRAEEAWRLARVGRGVELRLTQDKGHSPLLAKRAQVIGIDTIRNITHGHVDGGQREARTVDTRTTSQKLRQGKRVLAARKAYEKPVAILNEAIVHDTLHQTPLDAEHQLLFFRPFCHNLRFAGAKVVQKNELRKKRRREGTLFGINSYLWTQMTYDFHI